MQPLSAHLGANGSLTGVVSGAPVVHATGQSLPSLGSDCLPMAVCRAGWWPLAASGGPRAFVPSRPILHRPGKTGDKGGIFDHYIQLCCRRSQALGLLSPCRGRPLQPVWTSLGWMGGWAGGAGL